MTNQPFLLVDSYKKPYPPMQKKKKKKFSVSLFIETTFFYQDKKCISENTSATLERLSNFTVDLLTS